MLLIQKCISIHECELCLGNVFIVLVKIHCYIYSVMECLLYSNAGILMHCLRDKYKWL